MSEPLAPQHGPQPEEIGQGPPTTVASRLDVWQRAGGLSGGNQQKVVLAREIDRNPKVLIAAQPTRGLDVGAIEFVHRRLVEERDEGRAVLLVSLELEEILSLSDRILVIFEGRIVGEFPPGVSEEELGVAMTGGGRKAARRSRTRARAATTPRASRSGTRSPRRPAASPCRS